MSSHYRMRNEDEYEYYDEYEEYGSGEEEEEEEKEEELPSQEQQEFLRLREELKEKFRQKLKKETASHLGKSQDKKRASPKDNFGSFFGPSKPVIASRVIEERRSLRETQHITSRNTNPSSGNAKGPAYSSSDKKTIVHKQQPKVVNEVKKKVQTLKDMRDYSFLLSDDADLPDTKEEQEPPRKPSFPNSDGRRAQALASRKPQMANPSRPVPNGHVLKNPAAKNLQSQSRVGQVNCSSSIRPKQATAEPRKNVNNGSGSGRPLGHKPLPSKVPAQTLGSSRPLGINRPPTKVTSAVSYSSAQKNHYSEQRRPSQSLNNGKPTLNRPLPSTKSQPPKKIPPRDSHADRLKKKPMKRRLDESDDEDAIGMIRKMFGYNPNKYASVDDDVSDMEADYSEIQKEERRSAKIAQKEDEEQLRLIEEEERRERLRKKQKLRR